MKKERPDVETFAAGIADKQDNPTIHKLAKTFPEKTYKELEEYRNSDRQEEANQVPLTEAQRDLVEHLEAAVGKNKKRKGVCVTAEMRKDREEINWEEKYLKEHKLRQEAETETILVKGIGMNSPEMKTLRSEVEALKQQLHTDREKYKKENNDLFNRVADALAVNESHQRLNGKLQVRMAELEDENRALHKHVDKQIEAARKAGL